MKIVLATGGTGGHIFPAVEVAHSLRAAGHEVLFVGVFGKAKENIEQAGFAVADIQAKGLLDGSLKTIVIFTGAMVKGMTAAFKLLHSSKPDVVAGFGSYSSFPTVFVAWLLGYPTVIHEQNVVPGKANAVLAKGANRIAISFSRSEKYFGAAKTVWTGCPCHGRAPGIPREEILKKFNLLSGRKTILVIGGSQGSHRINEVFFQAMGALKNQLSVQAIHMTGASDYQLYREKYRSLDVPVAVCEFIHNIEEAYLAADVVISRAGAASVSEIAAFGLPSILIPYPFVHSHQRENARVLAEAQVAKLIEQKDLNSENLQDTITQILNGQLSRDMIKQKLSKLFVEDATARLAAAIVETRKA